MLPHFTRCTKGRKSFGLEAELCGCGLHHPNHVFRDPQAQLPAEPQGSASVPTALLGIYSRGWKEKWQRNGWGWWSQGCRCAHSLQVPCSSLTSRFSPVQSCREQPTSSHVGVIPVTLGSPVLSQKHMRNELSCSPWLCGSSLSMLYQSCN